MRRSTRNIILALIGSAGLLTCCVSSCVDYREEEEKDKDGKVVRDQQGRVVTHGHYYYRPWWYTGSSYSGGYRGGSGYGGSSYAPARSPVLAGGGSRSGCSASPCSPRYAGAAGSWR